MADMDSLAGKLLIAMPGMGDPRFARSVVYLCAHGPRGTLGLIVNKPAPEIRFADLLDQLGVARGPGAEGIRVRLGGPLEHGRGFVLHSADYAAGDGTMQVDGAISMTATLDVVDRISRGEGPARSLFALGYSGWGPGQLESELARNDWLTADAPPDLVFGADDPRKWSRALASIGVDPLTLSARAGHA